MQTPQYFIGYNKVNNLKLFIIKAHSPFVPPVSRNDIIERMMPNISTFIKVCTFPVLGSGRRSSNVFPRDIIISCCFVPEKLPCTACVMAEEPCKVKLYRYMMPALTYIWKKEHVVEQCLANYHKKPRGILFKCYARNYRKQRVNLCLRMGELIDLAPYKRPRWISTYRGDTKCKYSPRRILIINNRSMKHLPSG